ncbi:MAG: P1 family peptidase [Gammaproteobacteria bacterium]
MTTTTSSSTSGQGLVEFEFSGLQIGAVEYDSGPTGATVFYFPDKAVGAVDVRGGAPGTYNTDWLRLGYDFPNLDAITIAGGSWYGLAAAGGVSAALKGVGKRTGHWSNLANVAGAIIYDFGERRPNEIHPDEALGARVFEACKEGEFRSGAAGAGRMTMQGSLFGEWIHSGQGAAVREAGTSKIACFVVVNSVGLITDRSGSICTGKQRLRSDVSTIHDLLGKIPEHISTVPGNILGQLRNGEDGQRNTTISVVVTNREMKYHELNRLAIQVHSSMGRAIQPFGTANDGDVLFAVSTNEIEDEIHPTDLGVVASDVMWDAILNSIPGIPDISAHIVESTSNADLNAVAGDYLFEPDLKLTIARESESALSITNVSGPDFFGIRKGERYPMALEDSGVYRGNSLFIPELGFLGSGQDAVVVANPGPWQQIGRWLT